MQASLLMILFTRTCIYVENVAKEYQMVEVEEPKAEYQEQPSRSSRLPIKLQSRILLTTKLSKASPVHFTHYYYCESIMQLFMYYIGAFKFLGISWNPHA